MSLAYTQKLVPKGFQLCSIESMCFSAGDRTLLSKPFSGHAQVLAATQNWKYSYTTDFWEQSLHIKFQANNEFTENSQQSQLLKNTFILLSSKKNITKTLPSLDRLSSWEKISPKGSIYYNRQTHLCPLCFLHKLQPPSLLLGPLTLFSHPSCCLCLTSLLVSDIFLRK